MLDDQMFKSVISSTPLISIDLIVKKDNVILLGRRVNKPAKGLFFSVGGRVFKEEKIKNALIRIAKNELSLDLKTTPRFLGVFEHFYTDSIYENVTTHYVNLAYEINLEKLGNLPSEQHSEYQWFTVEELQNSTQVHKYVKDYFEH